MGMLEAVGAAVVAVVLILVVLDRLLERSPPRWDARGRSVLITGASSGIGEELAYQYAELGARVALLARRKGELERVRAALLKRAPGAEAVVVQCDVSKTEDCRRAVREVAAAFGGVDLVVANAGVSMNSRFEDLATPEPVHRMFEVNVFGVVDVLQAATQHLLRSPAGRVAVVSSGAGKIGLPMRSAYSATKFAVNGFCAALRLELAPRGVAVTVVCPGPVRTPISQSRVDGMTGESFDMNKAQPVDDCARQIVAAVARGDREAMIGDAEFRLKTGLLKYVLPLAPSLVDRAAIMTCQKSGLLRKDDPCTRGFGADRLG